ncbi:MAG: hypothetical protein KF757_06315 [Phycisphaeraceae bacterium]|nr:hypothetical protein [Phycisphaeraceae bacterium]
MTPGAGRLSPKTALKSRKAGLMRPKAALTTPGLGHLTPNIESMRSGAGIMTRSVSPHAHVLPALVVIAADSRFERHQGTPTAARRSDRGPG